MRSGRQRVISRSSKKTVPERHVHDRAHAETEDQRVIVEGGTHLVRRAGDEYFTLVENDLAPWRSTLLLAPTDGVGSRVAAVDALDFHRCFVNAHDRQKT